MATYVCSDLHGHYNEFISGLEKINFSDKDRLIVIGDAIDKGPASISLLKHIMDADNMDMVLGNHEFMMLNTLSVKNDVIDYDGKDSILWCFYNAGHYTLDEFEKLSKDDQISLLTWLNNRKLSMSMDIIDESGSPINIILTHSCYNEKYLDKPYSEIPYQDAWDIVWKSVFRDDIYCSLDVYTKYRDTIFFTGHVPVQRVQAQMGIPENFMMLAPYKVKNLVNIDGGLAYGPHITNSGAIFVCLETTKVTTVPFMPLREAKDE